MKYQNLQKDISTGHIRHCYLFYGDERYQIEKAVENITAKIIGSNKNSFNYQVFYGSETSGTAITQAALTLPFLSPKKFLLIKETEHIPDLENLVRLVEKTLEHCYLVFLADKVDFRQKFFAAFRKIGTEVRFWKPFESKLPGWIIQHTREKGFRITADAIDSLIGFCGTDLMRLENELEKVFLYVDQKKIIDAKDISEAAGGEAIHTIFELTDSIANGNVDRAVDIVNQLLITGEPPLKIMALIIRQFRNIWQGIQMISQGDSLEKIGKKLRVGKLSLKNFLAQTKRFNEHSLKRIFNILLEYDFRFKSSRIPPRLLMELLIIDICYPGIRLIPQAV
jgi:DNA polymerase-3 subunit delta